MKSMFDNKKYLFPFPHFLKVCSLVGVTTSIFYHSPYIPAKEDERERETLFSAVPLWMTPSTARQAFVLAWNTLAWKKLCAVEVQPWAGMCCSSTLWARKRGREREPVGGTAPVERQLNCPLLWKEWGC